MTATTYDDAFVSIGDLVYLYEETNGTVGIEGFTDLNTTCYSSSVPVEFGRMCSFKLMPQQMYTLSRQLKNNLDTKNENPDLEYRAQLVAEAKREKAHNESEVTTSAGRSLRYGKIVQIQHVASGKQVAVSHQASLNNRDARRVCLGDDDVGEAAWFKIMPKLRVHAEGEKVRSGDPVVFESVMTGLKLHVHPALVGEDTSEVNASPDASTFKLTIYRQSLHTVGESVNGGDAIRIMHREADGVLGTSIPRAQAMEDMCILTEPTTVNRSSSSIFIIEKDNPRDGSPCRWDETFRLRHVATGMLLQAGLPNDYDESGDRRKSFVAVAQALLHDGVSKAASRTTTRLRTVLTSQKDSPGTTFQLMPQYSNSDESIAAASGAESTIRYGALFGMKHVFSGLWLHYVEMNKKHRSEEDEEEEKAAEEQKAEEQAAEEKPEAAEEAAAAKMMKAIKARKSTGGGKWGALKNLIKDGEGHGVINAYGAAGHDILGHIKSFVAATRERHDEDMFTIRRAPADQYHDCLYIDSRVKLLKGIVDRFDERNRQMTQNVPGNDAVAALVETETTSMRLTGSGNSRNSTSDAGAADAEVANDGEADDLKMAHQTLSELVCFATESDNTDPFTREGLPIPKRQLLLTELQLFDLAIDLSTKFAKASDAKAAAANVLATLQAFAGSSAPSSPALRGGRLASVEIYSRMSTGGGSNFRQRSPGMVSVASELQRKRAKGKGQGAAIWQELAILGQRLARHILREHPQNKKYGLRVVPQLQDLLGKGAQAADTLREVFANNAEVLDMVSDDMIATFVRLVRDKGRQARFVEFLKVLCSNDGKAIRRNQWRVCKMFIADAPELHVKMRLKEDGYSVMVQADAQYFPTFTNAEEIEITEWLDTTSPATAAYFEQCVALYEVLVSGRNLKNTPMLQEFLPYDVVMALIQHRELHRRHLNVCTQFVGVARSLYIDNEPHQQMVRARPIRMWENIAPAAQSGKLSSRLVCNLSVDWHQFDELKEFLEDYLTEHGHKQVATDIPQNQMSLSLMRLLYSLVEMGFYTSTEVASLLPNLLSALDGTSDRVGSFGSHVGVEAPTDRYHQVTTIRCNTVVMMECKLWCCRVLQLVVTMRLDIRLSHLLHNYQEEWRAGKFGNMPLQEETPHALHLIQQSVAKVGQGFDKARRRSMGYFRMTDETPSPRPALPMKKLWDVLRLDADSKVDVVHVLLDLTFYEHHELVTSAMGLLVRHFEQRHVLLELVKEVRLLVKPGMVALYSRFDVLLRQLQALAARRRLFEEEPYHAVRLMSLLTMHCYEEAEDGGGGAQISEAGRSSGKRSGSGVSRFSAGQNSGHYTASHGTLATDSTVATYAHLVGKGNVKKGSQMITLSVLEEGERNFRRGDKIEIVGKTYHVKKVENDFKEIWVDRKIDLHVKAEGKFAGQEVSVWLFIVNDVGWLNADVQSLLYSMHAHELPLKLLELPFTHEKLKADELPTRAVVKSCYRLIKAMTTRFPLTQNALVPSVPMFMGHTEAKLVASDISPTECISAVYKDNSIVCTQVSEKMVRHFVRLAAMDHAPRYLRFLGMLVLPQGRPARRCQNLVVQCLLEKEDAIVLYNDDEGVALRAQLVEDNDHVDHPRGRLAYHIELISLLAKCIEGSPPIPVVQLRTIMPLNQLLTHLLQDNLPLALKAAYLAIFDGTYLSATSANTLQTDELREELLLVMDAQLLAIDRFVEDVATVSVAGGDRTPSTLISLRQKFR